MRSRKRILLSAVVAVFALSAFASATASAAPQWHFNKTLPEEFAEETVVGAAFSSSLKSGGASTTCEHFLYNMETWNWFGYGEGIIDELPLYSCTTTAPKCTVSAIEAEELPWSAYPETFGGKQYLIIEGIKVKIVYAGASCTLGTVHVTGTAGGLINNSNSTATFSKASFEATGTSMKIGTAAVEWVGEFPMEAFKSHREKAVEAY